MKFGARIIKTGIALILAIYISHYLNYGPIIFAAIAATLAIQPSVYRTWQYGIEQVQSNFAGATVALIFSIYFGTDPFVIAIAVMLVIAINLQLKFDRTIPLSIVTVLSIMEGGAQAHNFLLFAIDRFLLIFIGLASAILINALLFPPKYEQQLTAKLKIVNEQMSSLLRIILDDDKNERYVRTSLESLKSELDSLWNLFNFEEEAKSYFKKKLPFSSSRQLVIFKKLLTTSETALQMFRLIEKYQNIINQLPAEKTEKIQRQLQTLANYQERIFSKFEGKIHVSAQSTKELELLVNYHEFIHGISDSIEDKADQLDVLTTLAVIREYAKQLHLLDHLVDNYYARHKNN